MKESPGSTERLVSRAGRGARGQQTENGNEMRSSGGTEMRLGPPTNGQRGSANHVNFWSMPPTFKSNLLIPLFVPGTVWCC